MEDSDRHQLLRKGEAAARTSTLITAVLSLVKGAVGIISGSIALLADAVHSFSDIFASIAVWLGLKFAQKRPSERFPYGLYKVETLALLAVSVVILISGIETLSESIKRFWTSYTVAMPHITIPVVLGSILTSILLSQYKIKVGESVGSQALIGEGRHSKVDAYSSLVVMAGIILNYLGISKVEAIAGVIISTLILKLGIWMGKDAILVLLDVCIRPERIQLIRETAENIPGVTAVHNVKVRRAGPFVFGEMHLEVNEKLAIDKAHEISQRVEKRIKENIREMDSVTIHIEPSKRTLERLAIPVRDNQGLESDTHHHFGGAPYYILLDMKQGELNGWQVDKNPAATLDRKKGIETAHFLLDNNVNVLLTKEIGEGPFHLLRDALIEIYHLPQDMKIREIAREFADGKLKLLDAPTRSSHDHRLKQKWKPAGLFHEEGHSLIYPM